VKAAAVVAAATLTGGVAVVGSSELGSKPPNAPPAKSGKPGERLGQVAPRGVLVPGNGVARGKANAPGQTKRVEAQARARAAQAKRQAALRRSIEAKANAPGQAKTTKERPSATQAPKSKKPKERANTGRTSQEAKSQLPASNGSPPAKPDQPNGRASEKKAP
jgi:hypothetical protein